MIDCSASNEASKVRMAAALALKRSLAVSSADGRMFASASFAAWVLLAVIGEKKKRKTAQHRTLEGLEQLFGSRSSTFMNRNKVMPKKYRIDIDIEIGGLIVGDFKLFVIETID